MDIKELQAVVDDILTLGRQRYELIEQIQRMDQVAPIQPRRGTVAEIADFMEEHAEWEVVRRELVDQQGKVERVISQGRDRLLLAGIPTNVEIVGRGGAILIVEDRFEDYRIVWRYDDN